ncbi:hypothetical protein C3997_02515 [Escherichia coli]|nr:hypothetical protein C3997_02515 [Escherichia coli]
MIYPVNVLCIENLPLAEIVPTFNVDFTFFPEYVTPFKSICELFINVNAEYPEKSLLAPACLTTENLSARIAKSPVASDALMLLVTTTPPSTQLIAYVAFPFIVMFLKLK